MEKEKKDHFSFISASQSSQGNQQPMEKNFLPNPQPNNKRFSKQFFEIKMGIKPPDSKCP